MYRGRYRQGETVPLLCWCRNAAQTPTAPDDIPYAEIWGPTGTKIYVLSMAAIEPLIVTGLFILLFPLTSGFSATGNYRVVYRYSLGSLNVLDEDTFEIVAGGSVLGMAVSMCNYVRPQATFVLVETDDGSMVINRNPRLN